MRPTRTCTPRGVAVDGGGFALRRPRFADVLVRRSGRQPPPGGAALAVDCWRGGVATAAAWGRLRRVPDRIYCNISQVRYLSNRPLFDNLADSTLHVSTPAFERLYRDAYAGRNVLLVGETGSGKTSALSNVAFRLREEHRSLPCFVSLARAEDVNLAAIAIARAARDRGLLAEAADETLGAAISSGDPFAANQLVRLLADTPNNTTFLVDDVRGDVGHALFGRLRDELWQLQRCWIVAVDVRESVSLLHPPADAFFESEVRLEPLGVDERRRMLELRLQAEPEDYTGAEVEEIAQAARGNPRQLLTLTREVFERGGEPHFSIDSAVRGAAARRARAEEAAGRPAAMLVAELESLDRPVAAGDAELLARLGWTRPRAVDLLNRLESAGVVRSDEERRSGPGRPRKLYQLLPAGSFIEDGAA